MFLRSLALRGFKSFADRTVLEVEPGITVIVGPNGSGKSNVVDALAWVLGTHSAKKVRGGAMSDVVFAGSPTRRRAGQARAEIVIDNSDGRLRGGVGTAASAGEFSEVRIARVVRHDGEASYEINGEEVRALDVQELLSDTGLGRELHTIVGQGQLDEILSARPEERRRYVEEAAGILKHRRRRERALRKLEHVDAHVEKLTTVLRELRRQLKPLERQAQAADRHAALQAELREVRVSLAALELDELTRAVQVEERGGGDVSERFDHAQRQLVTARERLTALEGQERDLVLEAEQAATTSHRLESLVERVRGTADLVEARRRHLIEYVEEPLAGRPPAELRAQAERLEAERDERVDERDRDRSELETAVERRREAEAARREHEQRRQAERRGQAEQRERVLRWEGEISALRGAIATAESELGRIGSTLIGLDTRIAETERGATTVEEEIQALDTSEVELTTALEEAEAVVEERDAALEALRERARELESRRASQGARAEALRAALAESAAGRTALLDAGFDGVLGTVADHVRIAPEAVTAVAAALGDLGEAVVVSSSDDARRAVAWLRDSDRGGAVVLVADGARPGAGAGGGDTLVEGAVPATPLSELVATAENSAGSRVVVAELARRLVGTLLVADWDEAVRLHREHPDQTFVTADGDVAGPHGYRAGAAGERSAVATAAAAEVAEGAVAELTRELRAVVAERARAEADLARARRVLADATDRINESDAAITGAAERLARLHKELHSLTTQRDVVAAQKEELGQVVERDRGSLSELNARGPDGNPEEEPGGNDGADVGEEVAAELDARVDESREQELDARVRLERATEQVRHLDLRATALRREADEVDAALEEAARRRELRRRGIDRCAQLAVVVRETLDALRRSVEEAGGRRSRLAAQLETCRGELATARQHEQELAAECDTLRDRRHESELRRADAARRRENLEARIRSELSLGPEEVAAEHPGPDADRAALGEREDVLVRRIGMLGRVNPLALEEYRALEERHAFLADQLDDLRRSRKDLEEVVAAVDDRIREVFRIAFEDVAREFELTFATVFPGGHGRLVMTDADDLLHAGIEVEARPPGKRITRLSLLSGGERSLTVLAFVFAIFRARPSPFYVLDEVDAALDDVNLQRLLRIVRSFRGHAQVIMVTHQKRTMEIADVLYGVTMGNDGVTKVVAERLEDVDGLGTGGADTGATVADTGATVADAGATVADADASEHRPSDERSGVPG